MALYRLLLVDDEAEIRDGIRRKIDWAGCGFELVGSAENGQEALELAETLHPDVVLTDIKMPFMDGLTLAKRLHIQTPSTKVAVFSGFDDFEFAQKAMQAGVTEYILKPVDSGELTAVLGRLKSQLDTEFAQKRDMQALRAHYDASLPLLREQFYTRLIDGKIAPEQIESQDMLYEAGLTGRWWTVALFYYDVGALGPQRELAPLSVMHMLGELAGRHFCLKSLLYGDRMAAIVGMDSPEQVLSLTNDLNLCCKQARRILELTLTAGIGAPCDRLADLPLAAAGARSALDYRVLIGAGRAIYIGDLEPDPAARVSFDGQEERDLLSAIKLGTPDTIQSCAERFIARFREARLPLGQCQLSFVEMMADLLKVIRSYQIDPEEVFGKGFDGSFHLSGFASLDELGSWFTESCLNISSLIRRERTNSSRAIADRARQFIAEHYGDPDISVEMLCGHLHVSPAYFSTLFKKETGMSFVAYLTNVRMDEAVKLLSTTELKTYEIALKVGYIEPNYFSYVFKKQFGVSPTKYRSSHAGE